MQSIELESSVKLQAQYCDSRRKIRIRTSCMMTYQKVWGRYSSKEEGLSMMMEKGRPPYYVISTVRWHFQNSKQRSIEGAVLTYATTTLMVTKETATQEQFLQAQVSGRKDQAKHRDCRTSYIVFMHYRDSFFVRQAPVQGRLQK